MKDTRKKGEGHLYLRGEIYWIKYYRDGKPYFESTKRTDAEQAGKVLKKRLAEIMTGTFIGPRIERIRMAELAEDFLRDYRINRRRSQDDAEARWRLHLKPVFGHLRAVQVTTELVSKFIDARQKDHASNATINRELAALKRMFTLGTQSTPPKVNRIPHFPHLEERNVRSGFLTDEQYVALAKVCAEAGLWLRALLEVGYTYGWRVGELLTLRVRQINFGDGTIRLDSGTTKNDEARVITMSATVRSLLVALVAGKSPEDKAFTRDNKPIADFRGSWEKVTTEAKVPGLLFHDLRRTAVRNMIRAGVSERVAMLMSGHKTRAIFDRYHIVSERDLSDAVAKMERRSVTNRLQTPQRPAPEESAETRKLLN